MRDYLTLRDKKPIKIFVILQNAIQDSKTGNRLITRGKKIERQYKNNKKYSVSCFLHQFMFIDKLYQRKILKK
jgi:hypothetical protein